jgi:hypothetical protein
MGKLGMGKLVRYYQGKKSNPVEAPIHDHDEFNHKHTHTQDKEEHEKTKGNKCK